MRFLSGALAVVAAVCLAAGMDLDLRARVVQLAFVVAGIWIIFPVHLFNWWSHVALTALTGLTATALLQGSSAGWAVAAQCAALAAWDMAALAYTGATYNRIAADEDESTAVARGRMARFLAWYTRPVVPDRVGAFVANRLLPLAAIGAGAVAAALLATRVSFTLTLPWALLLGLALVLLLARIVRRALNPPPETPGGR